MTAFAATAHRDAPARRRMLIGTERTDGRAPGRVEVERPADEREPGPTAYVRTTALNRSTSVSRRLASRGLGQAFHPGRKRSGLGEPRREPTTDPSRS